jgi:hypothetical protein
LTAPGFATRAAAPAAAPFRKPRRPTGFFDFDMTSLFEQGSSGNSVTILSEVNKSAGGKIASGTFLDGGFGGGLEAHPCLHAF